MQANTQTRRAAVRAAFPHTIPVLTGFLFLGAAYGILMNSKGFAFYWSILMLSLIHISEPTRPY